MFPFEPLEVYSLFDSVLPTSTGIYAICNVLNGKYYIGSASAIGECPAECGFRFRFNCGNGHRRMLKENRHHSKYLQNAYNKVIEDGFDPNEVFQIWVVEYVEGDRCLEVEDEYLQTYDLFYNIAVSAYSPMKGRNQSPESCRLISLNSKSHLRAKTYVGIKPSGEVIKFTNINEFIRNNPNLGFNQANISACAVGKRRHSFGWRFFYLEDYIAMNGVIPPLEYAELGKNYVAISPSGEHIEFMNARQFCRDYPEWKFSYKNISACTKGEKKSHKGWQFFSQEDYQARGGDIPVLLKASYIGVSPNGTLVPFFNIAAFARENPEWNFCASNISACLRGKCKTYRKWRFYYAEDYYQSAA